jgi:hypothetical protein
MNNMKKLYQLFEIIGNVKVFAKESVSFTEIFDFIKERPHKKYTCTKYE